MTDSIIILPDKKCENCFYYREEADGDYGSGPMDIYCALQAQNNQEFKNLSGLDINPEEDSTFPYEVAPPCFEYEFWKTSFAHKLRTGSWDEYERLYKEFKDYLKSIE